MILEIFSNLNDSMILKLGISKSYFCYTPNPVRRSVLQQAAVRKLFFSSPAEAQSF